MPFYYRIHTKYKDTATIYSDTILTADNIKQAREAAKNRLSGSSYDDGSLPAFVKAERISLKEARSMYDCNPIDWIDHDKMREALM